MESSKLGNEKGVPFFNRRYTTGVPFLSIMVYKRVRGWTNLVPKAFPLITGGPFFKGRGWGWTSGRSFPV